MRIPSVVISDLHLGPAIDHRCRVFKWFLDTVCTADDHLVILGDLFNAWFGDDDDQEAGDFVAEQLAALAKRGTQITLVHGNRDFLIGEAFSQKCGAELCTNHLTWVADTSRFYLTHGDEYCTLDAPYMSWRKRCRTAEFQDWFLNISLDERKATIASIRKDGDKNEISEEMLDVHEPSIIEHLATFDEPCIKLLHGHTHQPFQHEAESAGHTRILRSVLGEWKHDIWWARIGRDIDLHCKPVASIDI